MTRSIRFIVVLLLASVMARAQEAEFLRPYVDQQTIVVARLDFSRLDVPALRDWLLDAVKAGGGDPKAAGQLMDEVSQPAEQWIRNFIAAGGTRLYVLGDTTFMEPIIVAPLAKDANAAALKQIIPTGIGGYQASQREGAIVWARPERLKQVGAGEGRPEIGDAMASVGDAAVAFVLAPSADARKVLEQLLPVLPRELGGRPIAMFLGGMSYSAGTLDTRPKVAMRLYMQMADAASARNVQQALAAMIDAARNNPEIARAEPSMPGVLEMLKPVADGNRTEIPLDAAATKLAKAMFEAATAARASARTAMSMNNAKQILIACHLHASDNRGEFPAKLEQTGPYLKAAQPFAMPHRPGASWIYLPPPPLSKVAAPDRHLVLHEPPDPWPEGGVVSGFADGHVELVKDPKQFSVLLDKTRATNQAK